MVAGKNEDVLVDRRPAQAAPSDIMQPQAEVITCAYTNWQGSRRVRTIRPIKVWFGSTEYHKEPQMLLRAEDIETGKIRDFAFSGFNQPAPLTNLLDASILKEAAEVLGAVLESGVDLPDNWRWPLIDELHGMSAMLTPHSGVDHV